MSGTVKLNGDDGFSTVKSSRTMQSSSSNEQLDSGTMKWVSPGEYETMKFQSGTTQKSDGTIRPAVPVKKDGTYVPAFAHLLKSQEQATMKLDKKPPQPALQDSKSRQIEATLRRLAPSATAKITQNVDSSDDFANNVSISITIYAHKLI